MAEVIAKSIASAVATIDRNAAARHQELMAATKIVAENDKEVLRQVIKLREDIAGSSQTSATALQNASGAVIPLLREIRDRLQNSGDLNNSSEYGDLQKVRACNDRFCWGLGERVPCLTSYVLTLSYRRFIMDYVIIIAESGRHYGKITKLLNVGGLFRK